MAKEIELFNRAGKVIGVALVDDEDHEALSQYRWHAKVKEDGRRYARRCWNEDAVRRQLMMHDAVVGKAPAGMVTDHVNRDSLDNRRVNLRFVTRSGNTQNRGLVRYNKSGFRGVFFSERDDRWVAQVKRDRKKVYRGFFRTKESAIEAVIAKRKELLPYATD